MGIQTFSTLLGDKQVLFLCSDGVQSLKVPPALEDIVRAQLDRTSGINSWAYPYGPLEEARVSIQPYPVYPEASPQPGDGTAAAYGQKAVAYVVHVVLYYPEGKAIIAGPFMVPPSIESVNLDAELDRAAEFIPGYFLPALQKNDTIHGQVQAVVGAIRERAGYEQVLGRLRALYASIEGLGNRSAEATAAPERNDAELIIYSLLIKSVAQLAAAIAQNTSIGLQRP